MNEILNIKEELDKIDDGMMNAVVNGFYNSRLKILVGMWEKGRVIGISTGVEIPEFRQLEKETGRGHTNLKQWYELFINNREKRKYIERVAKPKALAWAQKALQLKSLALEEKEIDVFTTAVNSLDKWVEKYSSDESLSEFIPIIEDLIVRIRNKNG